MAHAVEVGTTAVLMLYVDPDTLVGRELRACRASAADSSAWAQAGAPLGMLTHRGIPTTWEAAERVADAMLAALVEPTRRPQIVHPAVTRAVRLLPEMLEGDVRVATLAARVGISAGRLSHIFRAEVGIPLRPYVLWLRLRRAALAIQRGARLTDAAHEAGFADGAHLTRTFRRMFGIAPSEVVGWADWVGPPEVGSR